MREAVIANQIPETATVAMAAAMISIESNMCMAFLCASSSAQPVQSMTVVGKNIDALCDAGYFARIGFRRADSHGEPQAPGRWVWSLWMKDMQRNVLFDVRGQNWTGPDFVPAGIQAFDHHSELRTGAVSVITHGDRAFERMIRRKPA